VHGPGATIAELVHPRRGHRRRRHPRGNPLQMPDQRLPEASPMPHVSGQGDRARGSGIQRLFLLAPTF